ncbi:Os05g0520401 [Oryza sativa Japonica Group]|uniref:Os05g0520401 protein n=1 Tax=Oryza sativa subsp. japonica TaxID=39947 RepID=A0A0P0WPW5_ORYSJ|nr:hypothetical protein EE612_030679 [Oryza sativa]BAS94935.1 Os05g0520401 [Oryza sativa Japonica Group]
MNSFLGSLAPVVRAYAVMDQEFVRAGEERRRRRRPVEQQRARHVEQPSGGAAAARAHVRRRLLVVVQELHLLLAPQLHHLAVGVGVLGHHERRARRRPVLRHEPPGLVPHPARVAQRLGTHGPRPPLRRLVRLAVEAPPPLRRRLRGRVRRRRGGRPVLLLGGLRRLLGRECRRRGARLGRRDDRRRRGRRRRRRRRQDHQARRPAARRDAGPLAPRLPRHGRLRGQRAGASCRQLHRGDGQSGRRARRGGDAGDELKLPEILRGQGLLAHVGGHPFQLRELFILRRNFTSDNRLSNGASC